MKKIFSLIIMTFFMFTLSACNSSKSNIQDKSNATKQEQTTSEGNYRDSIKANLDKNLKDKYKNFTLKTNVEDDSDKNKVSVDVDIESSKDITEDQIIKVRDDVANEIQKVIKPEKIEIEVEVNHKDKGTYTFTQNKWNKEID